MASRKRSPRAPAHLLVPGLLKLQYTRVQGHIRSRAPYLADECHQVVCAATDAIRCQVKRTNKLCNMHGCLSLTEVCEAWDVSEAVGRLHHFVDCVQRRVAHASRRRKHR